MKPLEVTIKKDKMKFWKWYVRWALRTIAITIVVVTIMNVA